MFASWGGILFHWHFARVVLTIRSFLEACRTFRHRNSVLTPLHITFPPESIPLYGIVMSQSDYSSVRVMLHCIFGTVSYVGVSDLILSIHVVDDRDKVPRSVADLAGASSTGKHSQATVHMRVSDFAGTTLRRWNLDSGLRYTTISTDYIQGHGWRQYWFENSQAYHRRGL